MNVVEQSSAACGCGPHVVSRERGVGPGAAVAARAAVAVTTPRARGVAAGPWGKPTVERTLIKMEFASAWSTPADADVHRTTRNLLVRHACSVSLGPELVESVAAALRREGGQTGFGRLVALVGSRVVARFAVLELEGRGRVTISPGHLVDASLIDIHG